MKLKIIRTHPKEKYTIGDLYIDGKLFCNSLEDPVRPATEAKIYGDTAIPAGTYRVVMSYSYRFKRVMPLLINVHRFSGIRIHAGNSTSDTLGCILTGRNTLRGMVTSSKWYTDRLYAILCRSKTPITIEIIDHESSPKS